MENKINMNQQDNTVNQGDESKQGQGNNTTQQGDDNKKSKTFTQEEVNDIVSKRLAKQKESLLKSIETAQHSDELDEREKKITERELKAETMIRLTEEGLPKEVAELLNYENKENWEESYKTTTAAIRSIISNERRVNARQATPHEGTGGYRSGDEVARAFNGKR